MLEVMLRDVEAAVRTAASPSHIEDLDRRVITEQNLLERCLERDALQGERPEGCWCFGLGSDEVVPKYREYQSEDDEKPRVYGPRFCECAEGKALEQRCIVVFQGERMERAWSNSGVPKRFQGFKLETSPLCVEVVDFSASDKDLEQCLGPVLYKVFTLHGSMFLWGDYGTGKTGLAVGHARMELEQGEVHQVLFRSVPDLLSSLRSTYGRSEGPTENDIIDQYATAELLILDDMGAEQVKSTGWVEDRLYQIIGRRHGAELPTYFTSNLSPADLGAKIGERIVWRIIEMCGHENVIEVKGPNLRDKHGSS